MRVTVLVNLFFTVFRRDEGHFGNENLGSVHVGAIIETLGGRVAGVRDQGDSDSGGHRTLLHYAVEREISDPCMVTCLP